MELNRYVYAAGNPVRWGDPSGLVTIDFGGLLSSAKNSIQATLGVFYRSFTQSWIQGFTAGVLGWMTGKLILAWLLPEGNQVIGNYDWTTHLSNGVDLLAAGLLGIGFNSPLTSQLTANLGVSIFVSRVRSGGAANMLAAMQAARAQIVTSMTVLMSTIIPFKDWGISLAQGESMTDATVETVLDLFKAVIYGGGAYTSSMIISQVEIHSFGNAIDRFLSRNGLRAYILTTLGVVFDGLVNLTSDTFDNVINAPTN
jgi:hypothetical protein